MDNTDLSKLSKELLNKINSQKSDTDKLQTIYEAIEEIKYSSRKQAINEYLTTKYENI